ncbi:calcineurin-like phosphoesterase family protein [Gimesia sp.]|uniref:calcineurin-like phosphoesterase family protein n=1 Tax=Gimesia sp. TaxID=2024833 RepID=UPI000C5E4E19|nr:calcineurin-like phosphoesterase family protein [Gimesia sp.]MAX36354.1 metallophosphoesterase [Gimesia sp.]HBL42895.1 metallophosphoesterase [Planctomycetaceae bacterium]|tara:strand:- start:2185 stop:3849 length:1665 start_codon:yes stop_codon:yes gene_type:complete
MSRLSLSKIILAKIVLGSLLLGSLNMPVQAESKPEVQQTATGYVFQDTNRNRKRDPGEQGLGCVRVSNGREVVCTDQAGKYELPVNDDTILFVIKPQGWRTPLSKNLTPEFYYIHKPAGSPQSKYPGVKPTGPLPASVDFPLYPQKEPAQFRAIFFGDPQPRDQKEIDYIAHDVIEELVGTDASFGVTLGDILFDDLSLFESQARGIALLGIPWYNVIGNHDINYDAPNDKLSDETFERAFGPAYYSFDYGQVHFIVLDDINWIVPEENKTKKEMEKKGHYEGGLGKEQIEFVKNDLQQIPDDQLVVLMMHIPLVGVEDRQDLYRLIEKRPFCMSISGHTHHHEHRFITKEDGWRGPKPHHHIINVTVSGSWWSGSPDERGIPHTMMADGAPNGYSIITFDGTEYDLDFRAAGRAASYQMNILAPEEVTADQTAETEIFANIFNGSERSKVEMLIGESGSWTAMEQIDEIDPSFNKLSEAENAVEGKKYRDLPKAKKSSHLWRTKLPAGLKPGTHLIRIRTVEMDGDKHQSGRVIRILPAKPAEKTASTAATEK